MLVKLGGFFDCIVSFFSGIFALFNRTIFDMYGYTVSLSEIMFVCVAFYLILAVFWRGAKG